jgi:hypothetical protein
MTHLRQREISPTAGSGRYVAPLAADELTLRNSEGVPARRGRAGPDVAALDFAASRSGG